MGLFEDRGNKIPVWFMRQAGRYHSHYQKIREKSDFMAMCKNPELACEITMGPVDDFGFDAAILFSDLLFPLEELGMGLSYQKGPPTLEITLDSLEIAKGLRPIKTAKPYYSFQKEAMALIRKKLSPEKTLLGFVGAPFTLFTYACEESHKGDLKKTKAALKDGRFEVFMEKLLPAIEDSMRLQIEGNADALCLFDTAAGELDLNSYKKFALPELKKLTKKFKAQFPNKKVIYYSKGTTLEYLDEIQDKNIDVLGIDWNINLDDALRKFAKDYYIQGNIDPSWLLFSPLELEKKRKDFWKKIKNNPDLDRWVAGLGHGVLPKTPEENVRSTVKFIQDL